MPDLEAILQLLAPLQALVHRGAAQFALPPSLLYGLGVGLPLILAYGLQILKRGYRHWSPTHLQAMGDREFEQWIARLWARMGYKTTLTPIGPDRGIDVRAERPRWGGLLGRECLAIQAKRYKADRKVTLEQVMQYAAIPLLDRRVHGVIIVTSSEFTRAAREEGSRLKTVRALVDGAQLAEMLNRHLPKRAPSRARRFLLPVQLLLLTSALAFLGAWLTDPSAGIL